MTIPKRSVLIVTLGTVATGATIATVALWINGLEEASWIAAVVTLPLTVTSLIVTLLQRAPSSSTPNLRDTDSRNESQGTNIHQENHAGANIAQLGDGANFIINTQTEGDSRKGRRQ